MKCNARWNNSSRFRRHSAHNIHCIIFGATQVDTLAQAHTPLEFHIPTHPRARLLDSTRLVAPPPLPHYLFARAPIGRALSNSSHPHPHASARSHYKVSHLLSQSPAAVVSTINTRTLGSSFIRLWHWWAPEPAFVRRRVRVWITVLAVVSGISIVKCDGALECDVRAAERRAGVRAAGVDASASASALLWWHSEPAAVLVWCVHKHFMGSSAESVYSGVEWSTECSCAVRRGPQAVRGHAVEGAGGGGGAAAVRDVRAHRGVHRAARPGRLLQGLRVRQVHAPRGGARRHQRAPRLADHAGTPLFSRLPHLHLIHCTHSQHLLSVNSLPLISSPIGSVYDTLPNVVQYCYRSHNWYYSHLCVLSLLVVFRLFMFFILIIY